MEKDAWKVLAIVFIAISVVEFVAFGSIYYVGYQELAKEETCAADCYALAEYYYYESDTGVCQCVSTDGDIVKEMKI